METQFNKEQQNYIANFCGLDSLEYGSKFTYIGEDSFSHTNGKTYTFVGLTKQNGIPYLVGMTNDHPHVQDSNFDTVNFFSLFSLNRNLNTLAANIDDADILEMYKDAESDEQFLEQMRMHRDNFNKAIAIVQDESSDLSMVIHRQLADMGMFAASWWGKGDIQQAFDEIQEDLGEELPDLNDSEIKEVKDNFEARFNLNGEIDFGDLKEFVQEVLNKR